MSAEWTVAHVDCAAQLPKCTDVGCEVASDMMGGNGRTKL